MQLFATTGVDLRGGVGLGSGMLGMVNLLSKTTLDPMQLDYVHTAEESGRSLFYLINDVLGTITHPHYNFNGVVR